MILTLILQVAAASPDTTKISSVPTPVIFEQQQDTTRRRRARAVEVSDAYGQRLLIHRWASYAMIPTFAAQYWAGQKLYDADKTGNPAPGWAKPVHSAGAATIAGLFGINTITGVWNLWDSRHTPEHRWLRYTHSVVMLGADAAFAYTGIKLADDAEESQARRDQHRRVALYAIGASTVSGVVMKIFNR
jgi:hypothetical protein